MANSFSDDTLLARWLSGELTEEEAAAFQSHPDRADYERLARVGAELSPPAYDSEAELARLLARRKELVKPPAAVPTQRPLRAIRYWSVAAAVLLLLAAAWFSWPSGVVSFQAGAGELVADELSDGSAFSLNAQSNLTFTEGEQRLATLAGEGFFEVEKSSVPFVVETDYGTVTVLGTSFNVFARDGSLRVACLEGKVRVAFAGSNDSHDLLPGEAIISPTEGKFAMDRSETTDWLSGQAVFNDEPLREAIHELERQFDLEINLPPGLDLDQEITTAFSKDDAVSTALKSVFNTLEGLSFEQKGRRVEVKVD